MLGAGCSGGSNDASPSTPAPTPPPPAPPPPPPAPPAGLTPLKEAASARNMRFGTAISTGGTLDDAGYRDLVRPHCNVLVAENEMKWQALRPSEDRFDFTDADALVNFARNEEIDFRFHTLLWEVEERYPAWLRTYDFGAAPAAEAERLLTGHIARVASTYRDNMTGWDVVNEAVDPATGGYRTSPFSQAFGGMEAVLDTAFRAAREALPDAPLVYNDFMSWGSDGTHRDGVLRLLEGLLNRGTPIDALGLQSHLWGGNEAGDFADEAGWRTFLDEVTGMGLGLVVTELDVNDRDLPADLAVRDARIAEVTRRYLDLTMSYEGLRDVVVWGLVHRYSWLQYFQARADGLQKRGTPFDDDYEPTLMAEAIAEAFEATSVRP
nr:endo-1,4-beta-xylanase [Parvularcula dongshanensis]